MISLLTGDLRRLPEPRSERDVAELLSIPKSTVHADRVRGLDLLARWVDTPGEDEPEPAADRDERIVRNARRRCRRDHPDH